MVENGFDRMANEIASLRSDIGKEFESLRSDMNAQFEAIDKHFKLIEYVMSVASAFFTIALLAGIAVIFDGVMKNAKL